VSSPDNSSDVARRPRVAVVFDCFFPVNTGGGERMYRRLAEILVLRGYDVDYITRDQDGLTAHSTAFNVLPIWSGSIYNPAGNRTLGGALAFSRAILRQLRSSPDTYDFVVVSATPVLNLFATRAALFGSRTRIVADWLEVWPSRKWREYSGPLVGSVAFALQSLGLGLGHTLTAASGFTAARISSYRRKARPVVLGLIDVVPEIAMTAAPSHSSSSAPFVLFVGRHIADKQLGMLPDAVEFARTSLPGLTLKIVGTGPETGAVRTAVEARGQQEFVSFEGRVSDEQLMVLMATASVLVNPSRREGFGLVIAEAAACGTPSVVVASEDNAAVELIDEGINGFVASSTAPNTLGLAIQQAVSGGPPLRASTRQWFESSRTTKGMAASVDVLLARLTP
jgi:glycosyltransferase involved in cell wall biosynthesis